ncbi:MAG: Cof-type HAD-IIB family hydrolase [Defluviitaleaceae bacterium]|nr:Cof-type HAD-IIB family hydrolase [Defluviitaleaceae bacterium]
MEGLDIYKLVAIDMDGTLLGHGAIPDINKIAIQKAMDAGVHVVIASGRCIVTLRQFAKELGLRPGMHHIMTLNGAAAFDSENKKIRDIRMNQELADSLLEKILPLGLLTMVYTEVDTLYAKLPQSGNRTELEIYKPVSKANIVECDLTDYPRNPYKILLMGENKLLVEVEKELLANAFDMEFGMFFSGPNLLELTHKNSNKGHGLAQICDELNIDIDTETIAIGDAFNDLPMIKAAALGVAVKDAPSAIKERANYITERSANNGAVAEVLEKFLCQKDLGNF